MENTTVTFGQYQLVRRLARGGMAEIFLAIEQGIEGVERQVVLKRILPHMTEVDDFVTMFMDEARVAARFSHPNIAHIYNFGQVESVYFIAMEYVDGMTLSALMRQCRPGVAPIGVSLRIMADVCAGLHHAHETRDMRDQLLGVVHRDVSPQNIMVSRAGAAKLLDFGVARASTQAHSTRAGQLKGKLGYIAPEQFHNQPLDRRADVFSAGTLLYETLTGERAFVRDTEAGTVNAILYHELPPLPANAGFPQGTEDVIRRAVAKDPTHRFESAYDMQAALEHLIATGGHTVSSFVVGQFVSEKMAETEEARLVARQRLAVEDLLAESYPSGEPTPVLDLVPDTVDEATDPSIPPPDIEAHAAVPATVVTEPGYASQPSFNTSSVTPGPASDVPHRSRLGLIGLVTAGVLLVIAGITGGVLTIGYFSDADRTPRPTAEEPVAATSSPGAPGSPDGRGVKAAPVRPPVQPAAPDPLPEPAQPSVEVFSPAPDAGGQPAEDPNVGGPDADAGPLLADSNGAEDEHEENASPGRLYLHTNPWSKVRISGRSYGATPLMGVSVPAGRHTLSLVDAEGRRHSRRIVIAPGSATKLFIDMSKVGRPQR